MTPGALDLRSFILGLFIGAVISLILALIAEAE